MQWLAAHFQEMETFYPGTESSAIYNRVKHRSFSALHEGIKEAIDREGNRDIVFPPHYFSPKEKGLFAEHDHASTWFRPGKEFEEKLKKRMEDVEKKTARARVFLFSLCGFDLAVLLLFFLRRWNLWLLLLPCLLVGCDKKKETVSEFEQLMGKTSEHWKHVTQQEDKEALDSYQALYEKNKHYLSALAPHQKIPKIIHFIWLGPKPFPPESVENVRSWIAYHPDWKVKFWTDRERPVPCSSMERVLVDTFSFQFLEKCFHESQNYGEKSDILRFEILYKEGGVYADHDANCLIPFANLHAGFDFYCGLETPHPSFVGLNITSGNGLLGARPHHPVIKKVIELIAERWDFLGTKYRGRDAFSKSELVMQRTYIALTHALKECVDKESNIDIILPSAHFFAKNGLTPLYSKHFFATAWAETSEKKSSLDREMERTFEKLQKRATQMQMAALLVIALNALLFGYKKK